MTSINHNLNVIYFHVPKTAGSYLQSILKDSYKFHNYNQLARPDLEKFNDTNKNKVQNIIKDIQHRNPYCNRFSGINNYFSGSEELINMTTLNREKWDKAFKFTFVRNPYTRFISGWNYILSKPNMSEVLKDNDEYKKFENIDYFIEHREELCDIAYNHIFLTQYDHILNYQEINDMNFIGKQEKLEEDLEKVLKEISINKIKHEKEKNINKNKIDYHYYKTYYTETSFHFVNNYFDIDFKEFNYKKYNTLEKFLNEDS